MLATLLLQICYPGDMAVLARLRVLRLEQAWSQRELAYRAGVTQVTVVRAEAGANVQPSTQRRLAEALGVHPRELVAEGADPGVGP